MIGELSLLHLFIALPLVAAAAVSLGASGRGLGLISSIGTLVVFGVVFYQAQDPGVFAESAFAFGQSLSIWPQFGFSYAVGVDGLSLAMLGLTSLVSVAVFAMANPPDQKRRLYYVCLLLISAGCFGAFVSTDLFFFYAFHELALIPTFLLIGMFGSGQREEAAWRTTVYLGIGSFVLLLGLIALILQLPVESRTLDMTQLVAGQNALVEIAPEAQGWVFLLLLVGFGSLVSLVPFHSWAAPAYASAPRPAAMLHAGVLKKFGLYGLIRLALPLLPEGFEQYTGLLLGLLVANILYMGFVTLAQKRLDTMLGASSVMHMGYIFLGLAAMNELGLGGAILLMVAHGITVALLFGLVSAIEERGGSLDFAKSGGLAKTFPVLGLVFGIAAFASIGLPGLGNFSGEVLVFMGAFSQGFDPAIGFGALQWATVAGVFGVLISATYMLRAYRACFLGEPGSVKPTGKKDLRGRALTGAGLLVLALLILGFAPVVLTRLIF
ncbi:MAG: NuoM family protein [Verrucomicrobiales bacterium]